jgi:site-specific DNA recombinase
MKNNNVITYARVSTEEQANNGFSIPFQTELLRKYCELKGLNQVHHFDEDYSAKNFERPAWSELMKYAKKHKASIDQVLFTKWDRFSRNIADAWAVIKELKSMGITVNAVEQPLDMSIPDNKVMLSMYLIIPEVENDKISQRTKDGMRQAKIEGCYIAKAPFGYDNLKLDQGIDKRRKRSTLIPNNDASIVLEAFKQVSMNIEAVEVIRQKLMLTSGLPLKKQQFYNMLRNNVYCGLVHIPEHQKEPAFDVKGLHPPIVDEHLFTSDQNVLVGKRKLFQKIENRFPLRGVLTCPVCGRLITASQSKGNGGLYGYYHCKPTCHVRVRCEQVHDSTKTLLNGITLNANILDLFKAVLKDTIKKNHDITEKRLDSLRKEKINLEMLLSNAEDKFIKNQLEPEDFNRVKSRYLEKMNETEFTIRELEWKTDEMNQHIDGAAVLLGKLGTCYELLGNDDKGPFLGVIFPEKLTLENGKVRTSSLNMVVELLTRFSRGLESNKMEKAIQKNGFSIDAPQPGLEPGTP